VTIVAAIQMVSVDDVAQNLELASGLVAEAAAQGAALVVLPENFAVLDCGPVAEHAEVEGDPAAPIQRCLAALAREHAVFLQGGTLPLSNRPGATAEPVTTGRVRPSSLLFGPDGSQLARYDKIHLFDVLVDDAQAQYSESLTFEPGERVVVADTAAGRLGMSICYDLRFPELYRRLLEAGAELISVPSAFTRVTGEAHWEVLLRARAIENQCYVIAPNQGGRHNKNRETWGHTMIIDPWGRVLACRPSGAGVVLADVDLAALREVRDRMPVSAHRRADLVQDG